MSIRFFIASLLFMMVNAVVFGVGLVSVLTLPSLARHAIDLIPAVVVASFVISAPLAWIIAPRLRASYWRQQRLAAN